VGALPSFDEAFNRRTAKVRTVARGVHDVRAGGLRKLAREELGVGGGAPLSQAVGTSYFIGGARKLDVRGLVERVADLYSISPDPSDYLFEAIRANTTNAPNENNDGFHQNELLRFDLRLGMPVYYTYSGKPHHVDHRTENPHAARGVIVDSHYNTDTPPLTHCPGCRLKTADRQNRDESGLHCRRCGTLTADHFVEILVGVDMKKDPLFAEGVRTGRLAAGSMGCNCLSTVCNVCNHVAYSRPEFCEHIRSGNKGSLWVRKHGGWAKSNKTEVGRALSKRGYKFIENDFCYVKLDGFEARKAFEYCQGVIFDEYSRVDQPADPKALQREILKAAHVQVPAGEVPTPAQLRLETEHLLRAAAQVEEESQMSRSASNRTAMDMPGDDLGMAADMDLEALELAPGEVAEVRRVDEAEGEMFSGDEELLDENGMPLDPTVAGDVPAAPGAPGVAPMGIEQLQEQQTGVPAGPAGLAATAPQASRTAPRGKSRRRTAMRRFAQAYADWTVEVTEQGNARLLDGNKNALLVVRGSATQVEARHEFGKRVLATVLDHGVVEAARRLKALWTPKVAQVVDGAMNDMQGYDDHNQHGSVLDGEDNDMQLSRETPPADTRVDAVGSDDMAEDGRGSPPAHTLEDGEMDHEKSVEQNPSSLSATDEDTNDMEHKRPPYNVGKGKSPLDDGIVDHAMGQTAKRKYASKASASSALKQLLKVGSSIKHGPSGESWKVTDAKRSSAKECQFFGPVSAVVQKGSSMRRIGARDLLDYWHALDARKPAPSLEDRRRAAAPPPAAPPAAAAVSDAERKKYEARLQKLTLSRIAKVKAEAEADAGLKIHAGIDAFCRALRIVAKRQSAGLERSPIRQAAEAALCERRAIGTDAASRQPIMFDGLDNELGSYLAAQIEQLGQSDHLELSIRRARELMKKGDQYLLDAEADLKRVEPSLPKVTASVLTPVDPAALQAAQTRQAAVSGNFQVTPAPVDDVPVGNVGNKRSAIRGAVNGTLVSNTLNQLRQDPS